LKIENFMKSFPKILTILFLSVFILQVICLFFLLAAPVASRAENTFLTQPGDFAPQTPNFEEDLGYKFNKNDPSTGNIANLVKAIYKYAIGIVGILAAVVLMVGGVLWIMAGGNATQVGEAKAWIGASLTGLVLALTSYLILNTVNPALVNLQITKISSVSEMKAGCCTTFDSAGKATFENNVANSTCTDEKKGSWQQGQCAIGCCVIHGLPNDTYQESTSATNCTKISEKLGGGSASFSTNACPTPCCLYGSKSVGGMGQGWAGCKAEVNLSEKNCKDLGTPAIIDKANGKCQEKGTAPFNYYICASK
jgi:hypothetical protein